MENFCNITQPISLLFGLVIKGDTGTHVWPLFRSKHSHMARPCLVTVLCVVFRILISGCCWMGPVLSFLINARVLTGRDCNLFLSNV